MSSRPASDGSLGGKDWVASRWMSGVSLEGKTVGILGMGAIGKHLVQRLAGFDCRMIAYDPFPDIPFAQEHLVELLALEDVVAGADFLSLHMPLVAETRRMVNAAFLSRMKKGSFIINTARGEVIDEDALASSLISGHLRGAGLDAFVEEPPRQGHPLLSLPNVIATPLLGAQTDGATDHMGWWSLHDCLAVLRGETPLYRVG